MMNIRHIQKNKGELGNGFAILEKIIFILSNSIIGYTIKVDIIKSLIMSTMYMEWN